MSLGRIRTPARRMACALAICGALFALGLALTLLSSTPSLHAPFAMPVLVLLPLYLAAQHFTLDFELRGEAHSVVLTQIPLALGTLLVAPGAHIACRLVAAAGYSAARRQSPVKTAYNVATAAFEVGVMTAAVSSARPSDHPGVSLWIALYAGFVIIELAGPFVLYPIWRLLSIPVTLAALWQQLTAALLAATLFSGLAIVSVLALWTEPASAGLLLVLAGGLGLAYRAHRRLSAQQATTGQLYDFVKDLGPLTPNGPDLPRVLEQIRELMQARHLDLALPGAHGWRHIAASEAGPQAPPNLRLADHVKRTNAPLLRARQADEPDQMATPLIGSDGFLGVITTADRLGSVRDYDMGDLRLLETVATELTAALERGQLLENLQRAATTDSLTELPNLPSTTRGIDDLLAQGDVLLAAVAVESFREVNDQLGHQHGDALLVEVTRRLLLAAPNAIVGRIGGGRFAVVIPAHEAGHDPAMFGLGLRSSVEGNAQIGAIGTHIRLAVGVVRAPDHGTEAATLLRRAETAMHSARAVHGGPVVWEPAYEIKGQRRLAVVRALREALATGAIGLAYQPKVHLASGRISGVEALARWTHPALGVVTPDEFIPLAEASGLMAPLTSGVLRQALTACRGWQQRSPGVGVAVNVSADTVLSPTFVTQVHSVLSDVDVDPSLLTLELTEGVVVADPQLAAERMSELRALGVAISVDDFGTGYSSLTYLKGLPVNEVKIDKGFIAGVVRDRADQAVVRAVVDIAHTLGLRVIAEGVEEQSQHELLQSLGVDEVQGYLHARPMAALDMMRWMRDREQASRLG